MPKLRRISCCVCNRKVRFDRRFNCSGCKAVNFCSELCLSRASDPSDVEYHSPTWCSKLERILLTSPEFTSFPFPWSFETTSDEFDGNTYAAFLKKQGVLDQGLWRFETCNQVEHGKLQRDEDPYVLPVESVVLQDDVKMISTPPMNWEEYYDVRGFSIDSPICILLQWPLTLYYVISHRLPIDYPGLVKNYAGKSKLSIHIVGVEKEANIFQAYEELSRLLPHLTFDLTFIGPSISPAADGKTFRFVRMTITLRKGNYHQVSGLTNPDLVLGHNAGLPAYITWSKTIAKLEISRPPAFFTEYCWPAVEYTRDRFDGMNGTRISDGTTNPFRSPIRVSCPESEIPRLSNGILFHLIYRSDDHLESEPILPASRMETLD